MLATEGMMKKVTGCELTECSEIVESEHRGCLRDMHFAECSSEEFMEGDVRYENSLNTNRELHRKKWMRNANKC